VLLEVLVALLDFWFEGVEVVPTETQTTTTNECSVVLPLRIRSLATCGKKEGSSTINRGLFCKGYEIIVILGINVIG
jgi:hypothetical protein